jgi:hypothetical protein
MSAFRQIVDAIDSDEYDARWSISVALDPNCPDHDHPDDGNFWIAQIQFTSWGSFNRGVKFYRQAPGEDCPTEVPESQAPVDSFVKFFTCESYGSNPQPGDCGSGSGSGSSDL